MGPSSPAEPQAREGVAHQEPEGLLGRQEETSAANVVSSDVVACWAGDRDGDGTGDRDGWGREQGWEWRLGWGLGRGWGCGQGQG